MTQRRLLGAPDHHDGIGGLPDHLTFKARTLTVSCPCGGSRRFLNVTSEQLLAGLDVFAGQHATCASKT